MIHNNTKKKIKKQKKLSIEKQSWENKNWKEDSKNMKSKNLKSLKSLKKNRDLLFDKKRLAMAVAHENQKKCQALLFRILNERITWWWEWLGLQNFLTYI